MGAGVLQCSMFFLLCLFLISGSSIAEKPPPEAIQQNKKLDHQGNQIIFSTLKYTTQLDATPVTIPIVNPTTPTTTTPIVTSPPTTPIVTSPPTTPFITSPPTTPIFTSPPTTPIVTSPPPPTTTQPIPTPTTTTPASSGGSWCIASPTASQTALQVALDYACGYGGTDCSAIQQGASCYNPNTFRDHASYAFNNYYQKNPVPTSCAFGGTAQLTYTDPSSGNCHYASPTTTPSTSSTSSPTTPSSMNSPTTPSSSNNPTTPSSSIFPTTPTGPTDYGSEPTGTPSSTDSASHNLLLLFTVTSLSLLAANFL
uniref:Putative mucin-2-like isoform X1 n=1 Tax=Davidia involucrata TaxID=16924 RepID=A0A5B7C0E0_DAVIN